MLMRTNAQDGNGHAKSLVPLSTPLLKIDWDLDVAHIGRYCPILNTPT